MLNQKSMKPILQFFVVCIISVLVIVVGNCFCQVQSSNDGYDAVETAIVSAVLSAVEEPAVLEGEPITRVTFVAEVKSGAHKGQLIQMEQMIDPMFLPVPNVVEVGDDIMVIQSVEQEGSPWAYVGVNRVPQMMMLVALFFILILCVGGWKGGATIVALLLSVGVIFFVYIPAILKGYNIYIVTILVAVYIIFSSLILLNGLNRKTLCAIVGNIGGTLVAGLLALVVNAMMGVTGIVDQQYVFLMLLEGDVSVDLRAVVWGGILIGSLGAIMDVSMSIASAMNELAHEMEQKTMGRLVRSGLQIGRDAIGTMTNTLILAYVGGSLATVLLFVAYSKNVMYVLNLEMIVVEVIRAVVGSMGILFAVPLTVFFAGWCYLRSDK